MPIGLYIVILYITDVAKLWRDYSAPSCGEVIHQNCGEITPGGQFVARLPNLWRDYLWQGSLVANYSHPEEV